GDRYFRARRLAGKVEQLHPHQRGLVRKTGEVASPVATFQISYCFQRHTSVCRFFMPALPVSISFRRSASDPISVLANLAAPAVPTLFGCQSSTILTASRGDTVKPASTRLLLTLLLLGIAVCPLAAAQTPVHRKP